MQKEKRILIQGITAGSLAEEAGIEKHDVLISINGKPVADILDYRFLICDEEISIVIEKPSGEAWEIELQKDADEDIGLEFDKPLMDVPKTCRNRCIFCFMDQLPSGMRKTLRFKDDDYRLSFLEGNYVTLTNIGQDDLERIIRYRLSPVNISVHTTNGRLREKMLNNPHAGKINGYLRRLHDAGLDINCQIVLCKGINDGAELEKTIDDLSQLHPSVRSISVVPVGLTKYREGLYPLEGFDRESSIEVINQIKHIQGCLKKRLGTNLVYIADEFYINAGVNIPGYKHYEEFYQLENGVGMIALFTHQFNNYLKRLKFNLNGKREVSVVTGKAPGRYMQSMVDRLTRMFSGLEVYLYPIENCFFGSGVTVTGLVTGRDIIEQTKGRNLGCELLVPDVMLKSDRDIFLDDVTLEQLGSELGTVVKRVENNGREFIKAVLGIDNQGIQYCAKRRSEIE